ncbi:MAG: nickel ABC transporter permease subunit NikC [Peptococcaceae bacterium]|nr:nickel ABC transporter permease subunit NikC [Peptococcaceae bacterium]
MTFGTIVTRLAGRKLTAACLLIILAITLSGALAPILAPNDPNLVDLEKKLAGPGAGYPLGTDHLGRCILSRLMYGARISLGTAFLVMFLTIAISTVVGTLSGYRGGTLDGLIMRICDILLAFPSLVLALAVIGMLGPGLLNMMIAMVSVQWAWYARMIRGMVLSLRESGFVLSARVSGVSGPVIVARHILPNILSQVIVLSTLDIGWVILNISGMSFLGLGIQPPTPEWGAMLNDGRQFLRSNPSLMAYPGLMILTVVAAFNLIGDALRDALDPRET